MQFFCNSGPECSFLLQNDPMQFFCSMKTICSTVASSPDESEINILVWNGQFYSENAFEHKFQCLQLFIGISMQFIDFLDIGRLQLIEMVK